jgi:hypothetical protein
LFTVQITQGVYAMKLTSKVLLLMLVANAYLIAQTAQPQATMAAHSKKVQQGDEVVVTIKLTPTPNVWGTVNVWAAPEAKTSGQSVRFPQTYGPSTTDADAHNRIPIDGKVGVWKVTRVEFVPENSATVQLEVNSNKPLFEVTAREVVLPKSADVEVK